MFTMINFGQFFLSENEQRKEKHNELKPNPDKLNRATTLILRMKPIHMCTS